MMINQENLRRLYLEKQTGVLSEEEQEMLERILQQDPESLFFWNELEEEAKEIDLAGFINGIDVKEDFIKIQQGSNRPLKRIRDWKIIFSVAAAVVLLIIASSLLFYPTKKAPEKQQLAANNSPRAVQLIVGNGKEMIDLEKQKNSIEVDEQQLQQENNTLTYNQSITSAEMNTLLVPPTKDYKLVLADGTKVWLNAASSLRFPMSFQHGKREVFLKGEAYFEVSKDIKRPFLVHIGDAIIHVLGTSFNVDGYEENQPTTSLVEGRVKLEVANETLVLSSGDQVCYQVGKGFKKGTFDKANVLSWKDGLYSFQNKTLLDLSPVLQRWFNVEVVFDNPKLQEVPVTGLIEKQNLKGFLNDLQSTVNVNYRLIGSKLHFW